MIEFDAQRRPLRPARRTAQAGVTAITFLFMLIVMIGFSGLVIDLGRAYNRKVELQNVADSAALAAARELNGTSAGVTAALSKAATVVNELKYDYNQHPFVWNDSLIKFGKTPDAGGSWHSAGEASSAPDGLLFARVDTSELAAQFTDITAIFMGVLNGSPMSVTARGHAIAGRSSINVTPLAVCAQSTLAGESRANPGPPANTELVEYGFRRGVSYDLMQLNPGGTTPENFVVDPIAPPGVAGSSSHTVTSMVQPFVCTGSLAVPRVMGGDITVVRPFPLASLYNSLNSRFDQYSSGGCDPAGSPPDVNIKSFNYGSLGWMSTVPAGQTAASTTSGGKLWTIADPLPALAGNTAPMYGPLWSFAKAVPYSSYTPGSPEPANGYTTFSTSAWSTLYKPGAPVATGSYPLGLATPYRASSGAYFDAPSVAHRPGVRNRRVLNVPLLVCPVGGSGATQATVLAIGRFFMTVPATATSIPVEFAGVVQEQTLGGQLELYP
jgi:hypothetical protein